MISRQTSLRTAMQVFNGSRSTRSEQEVITNSALQQEWKRLQGVPSTEVAAAEPSNSSKPIEGDCPICYDEMHPGGGTVQVTNQRRLHWALAWTNQCVQQTVLISQLIWHVTCPASPMKATANLL